MTCKDCIHYEVCEENHQGRSGKEVGGVGRMKRLIAIVISIILIVLMSGCQEKEVINKTPVETNYTAAHTQTITQLIPSGNSFIPVMSSIYVGEEFQVRYEITFSDGESKMTWETVDESEYKQVKAQLNNE